MADRRNALHAAPIKDRGQPVSGPEVEFDDATKRALLERFAALDRAQAKAFVSAKSYVVMR